MSPHRRCAPNAPRAPLKTGGRARRDAAWTAEQGALRFMHTPTWRGQLLSLTGWSGLPLLGKIGHPVLVLTGDDDPLAPVANGMLLAHMLRDGRLMVFPGEGHLMVMDADSPAHPVIREFLSAPRLDRASVWTNASTVNAAELKLAFAGAGWQPPPWSIINASNRRRWLNGSDSS